jgi:hypothetical protein
MEITDIVRKSILHFFLSVIGFSVLFMMFSMSFGLILVNAFIFSFPIALSVTLSLFSEKPHWSRFKKEVLCLFLLLFFGFLVPISFVTNTNTDAAMSLANVMLIIVAGNYFFRISYLPRKEKIAKKQA